MHASARNPNAPLPEKKATTPEVHDDTMSQQGGVFRSNLSDTVHQYHPDQHQWEKLVNIFPLTKIPINESKKESNQPWIKFSTLIH